MDDLISLDKKKQLKNIHKTRSMIVAEFFGPLTESNVLIKIMIDIVKDQ